MSLPTREPEGFRCSRVRDSYSQRLTLPSLGPYAYVAMMASFSHLPLSSRLPAAEAQQPLDTRSLEMASDLDLGAHAGIALVRCARQSTPACWLLTTEGAQTAL